MDFFSAEFKQLFRSPDARLLSDYHEALACLPSGVSGDCLPLESGELRYEGELPGGNGSARLFRNIQTEFLVVMKTYEPRPDLRSEDVIGNPDRLVDMRRGVGVYFVSAVFPLVPVPPTALRTATSAQMKEWGVPLWYNSDYDQDDHSTVLVQKYIASPTLAEKRQLLVESLHPLTLWGLLCFDHLVAYGDGRMSNMLVTNKDLAWAIDNEKSFRGRGGFSRADVYSIPGDYVLEDTGPIREVLNPEKLPLLMPALELMIGKRDAADFSQRFTALAAVFSRFDQLTIAELRREIEGK